MNLLTKLLEKAGALRKKYDFVTVNKHRFRHRNAYYYSVLQAIERGGTVRSIDSIVFSKDRAMQLHAFLSSYREMVHGRGTMYILYKTSDSRHAQSYMDLQKIFSGEEFIFIEESDFRKQLLEICERSTSGSVALYVDDMIFTRRVDYQVLSGVCTLEYVPALSRGSDMNYSMVLDKVLDVPEFSDYGNGLRQFKWNFSKEYSDWTYPLGVSGYIYGRAEFLVMIRNSRFKAPNSLESSMQEFLPFFITRHGLCYEKVACVCVHANLVQTEGQNRVLGTFSAEELLSKWEEGLRIDTSAFAGGSAESQYSSYRFLPVEVQQA